MFEQRIFEIELRTVRELQRLEPDRVHREPCHDKAEHCGESPRDAVDRLAVIRRIRLDLFVVADFQVFEIDVRKQHQHYEHRYADLQLCEKLLEKYAYIAEFLEPQVVCDEPDEASKNAEKDHQYNEQSRQAYPAPLPCFFAFISFSLETILLLKSLIALIPKTYSPGVFNPLSLITKCLF